MKQQKILFIIMLIFLISLAPASFAAQKKHHHPHSRISQQADVTPPTPDYNTLPQFRVAAIESDPYGFIGSAHWGNYLNQNNAFGFQVDFGGREFRLGGTWAHVLSANNRFKITAEHFAQQPNFVFLLEQRQQWVGQNDVGANYQYLVSNNPWLKSFAVSGYYVDAESENIQQLGFTTPQGNFIEMQRFTGATAGGGTIGMGVQPWTQARAEVDLNYDQVNYATVYQPAKNNAGLGATVTLQQIFSPHWKAAVLASDRQIYDEVGGGIYYLMNTRPGTRLEWGLAATHLSSSNIIQSPDNRIILGATYSWGGNPCEERVTYADDDIDSLINWTMQPAVAMPALLVQQDEGIIRQ